MNNIMHYKFDEAESIISGRTLNRQQYFEPTIATFKNALVINYKKVGTRFMGLVSSLPENFNLNKLQFDLYFTVHPRNVKNPTDVIYHTPGEFGSKNYIYTSFDIWEIERLNLNNDIDINIVEEKYDGFNHFKTTREFLKYEGVNSIHELLFQNKHKDIILILRHPIKRYISGATQVMYYVIDEIPKDENLRNEIKFFTNITDTELRNLHKLLKNPNLFSDPQLLNQLDEPVLAKMLEYLVEKRTDLMFQDIHTQNYLRFYIDFINKVEDKSRIKIIDIDDCMSPKAHSFFDKLRGDTLLSDTFYSQLVTKESNKFIYNFFVKKFLGSDDFWRTSMRHYLESEFYNYELLINSPYYVNLNNTLY